MPSNPNDVTFTVEPRTTAANIAPINIYAVKKVFKDRMIMINPAASVRGFN